MFRKNTASQFIHFQGVDATTGGIKTGVSWTVRRCIDGTFAAGGGTVTEDGTTGWYKYAMSQADTNGNDISFNFTGTGAVPQTVNIITTAADPTTATNFGITSLPTTACTTNASLLTSGTGTDQISVSAGKVLLQATQSGVTIPTVTTVTNQLTAAAIATGIWQDTTAGDFTTASSIGKSLYTSGIVPGAAGGLFIAGSNAATTFATGSHFIGTVDTVTTVTNQLTAAAVATAIWQDTTSGDFTTVSSIGKSLYTSGNAPGAASGLALVGSNVGVATSVSGAVGSVTGNVGGNVVGSVGSVTGLTTATIATAVWTDTTAGDFTTLTSPGKIIFAQLGGAFTTTSSSVYTVASLANAPTGGSAPTTAQIATAVWEDLLSGGDFGTTGSIGKLLNDDINATISSRMATFSLPTNFAALLISVGGHISNVDTLTTYTGDTPQTGDSFARIGAAGAGLTALGDARITNLDATISSRASATVAPSWYTAPPSSATIATAVLTTAMTESYPALHVAPTLAQAVFVTMQRSTDMAIVGSAITVYKLDGTTSAYVLTTDSATAPTLSNRTS